MPEAREFLFDKRMVDRHVKRGAIEAKQYEKFVSGLANVESNADYTHIEMETEIEEDEK